MPDGWHEVNIKMFQELSLLEGDGEQKAIELISILADKDPDEIKTISPEDFKLIIPAILWTNIVPTDEYKTDIEIDGITYYLQKLKSLSLGEWIDLDKWCENSTVNLHKIFALLYRPVDEEYDVAKMNARAELFLEKLMISDVYGTLLFFLIIGNQYLNLIKDYTKEIPKTS